MIFRYLSFQKLNELYPANNVLEAPASNTNVFLSRDTFVSLP
jgi:hypothetical protein